MPCSKHPGFNQSKLLFRSKHMKFFIIIMLLYKCFDLRAKLCKEDLLSTKINPK